MEGVLEGLRQQFYQTLLWPTSSMTIHSIPPHCLTARLIIKVTPSLALPLVTHDIFPFRPPNSYSPFPFSFFSLNVNTSNFYQASILPITSLLSLSVLYPHTFRDPIFRVHEDINLSWPSTPSLFSGLAHAALFHGKHNATFFSYGYGFSIKLLITLTIDYTILDWTLARIANRRYYA